MKKPTMQDIADAAGVSRVTVWKVLNNHSGVSESMSSQILQEAVQLAYPLPPNLRIPVPKETAPPLNTTDHSTTISVVVSRPDSSIFWSNTIHEIAKEISKLNCNLMYTYVPTGIPEDYILPAQLTNGYMQGIIVLNVYDHKLLSMLNELAIPKVFLDTVNNFDQSTLSGDLILLEGKSAVETITNSFIDKEGYTQIGFIGDIDYAVTNHLRYDGYLASMEKHQISINPAFIKTGTIGIETYREEIFSYLSHLKNMPEAFVCVSDFVASIVYQYLSQNGYSIPEDIALSGYDNITDYIDMSDFLTTVNVNTSSLGNRLITQLMYRIQNSDAPLETIYLKSEIIFKGTRYKEASFEGSHFS